ncbi:hypothetical protein BJ741DRAFT_589347 [Chytriomyces cf. hyalinus JEL632]|nr:hypothetical protein BJ741DRAFT_589347 [Chytriomyces cf. hyalinus JEL632]
MEFFFETDADDLFGSSNEPPPPPRHVMPDSYPYPLAEEGLFLDQQDALVLKGANHTELASKFESIFDATRLSPSNISQLIEHLYMQRQYPKVLEIAQLWIAENQKRSKPFSSMEVCDIGARAALRCNDTHTALHILENCKEVDLSFPSQTTVAFLFLRAQVHGKTGQLGLALNGFYHYLQIRLRDFRAYVETAEAVTRTSGYESSDALKTIRALALRRACWILSQSVQLEVLETELKQRHNAVEVARLDAMVQQLEPFVEAFDASEGSRARDDLVHIISVLPNVNKEVLEWMKTDVLLKNAESHKLMEAGDEENEGRKVSEM